MEADDIRHPARPKHPHPGQASPKVPRNFALRESAACGRIGQLITWSQRWSVMVMRFIPASILKLCELMTLYLSNLGTDPVWAIILLVVATAARASWPTNGMPPERNHTLPELYRNYRHHTSRIDFRAKVRPRQMASPDRSVDAPETQCARRPLYRPIQSRAAKPR